MGIIDRITSKTELKLAQIERKLGFGNGTIRKWDISFPSFDKVIAVADLIGVSVDYLAGRDETKKEPTIIPDTNKNPEIQQIIHKLATFEVPDDVIEFINNALNIYKK